MTNALALPALAVLLTLAALPSPAQSITTMFAGSDASHTTSLAVRPSVSLDLEVLHPAGIVLHRLDLNVPYQGLMGRIELYTTEVGGSYVGTLSNPAPGYWKLRSSASFTSAGSNNITAAPLDKPVVLRPGTHGVTIVYEGITARFFNIVASPPTQTVFSNGDVTLHTGARQNEAFVSAAAARVPSLTFHYTLPGNDVVDFTADVHQGPGPLVVNLTDRSITPSGPILGWDWDFDNDGIVDATTQNALAVYPLCGSYSVRLRIHTSNGPLERLWPDLIQVDPLRARFSASQVAGTPPSITTQFLDTSTGGASQWAWDFDGDGVTDSTLQSPGWTFATGAHNVSLTVTNGCRVATTRQRITVTTHAFNTTYAAAANFTTPRSMVTFDLTVTSAEALVVAGLDVNALSPLGNLVEIEVWLTDGTWVGKHLQPAQWRMVAEGSASSAGGNAPTQILLDRPFLLLPGATYGVGIHYRNSHAYYYNPGQTYTNADLDFAPGAAIGTTNGVWVNANLNQPRQWSGGFHYVKASQWPIGALTWYGPGCAGALGVPRLLPNARHRLRTGATTTVRISALPQNAGFMMLGLGNTTSPLGPLPLDLSPLGIPGCFGRTWPATSEFVLGSNQAADFSMTLPNNPGLAGAQVFLQALVLDPAANQAGLVLSDAMAGLAGVN